MTENDTNGLQIDFELELIDENNWRPSNKNCLSQIFGWTELDSGNFSPSPP